jgi:hypothetical protein
VGYDTSFHGCITIEPPLNAAEVAFLRDYAATRHCTHQPSQYATSRAACHGSCGSSGVGVPEFSCNWEATEDGTAIEWNGEEEFYNADEWMEFIIKNFLAPGEFTVEDRLAEPKLASLQRNHTVNGTIDAEGEEAGDIWRIVVKDNVVSRVEARVVWPGEEE